MPIPEHRSRCIGTGPFKFKEWKRGQSVDLVRNPEYFVKGRPYLDAARYTVIVERGTRVAALQANQIDVAYPGETTLSIAEQLKGAVPNMVFTETASNVSENLLLNTKKPPFDNVKVRRALSFAIDRRAYIPRPCTAGAAVIGACGARPGRVGAGGQGPPSAPAAALRRAARPPRSSWRAGSGRATRSRSRSSRAPSRSTSTFRASVGLKQGVEARSSRSRPRSGIRWSPAASSTSANLTGLADRSRQVYENYACGLRIHRYARGDAPDRQQPVEVDAQRVALVWQIQKKLEEDAARPTAGWQPIASRIIRT